MAAAAAAPAAETIAVYARLRSGANAETEISVDPSKPQSVLARQLEFNLDHAFGSDVQQSAIYEVVGRNLVERVVAGFNAAVLAYGQTGSGKTFTMLGPEGAKLDGTDEGLGIVPRACLQLFSELPAGYTVSISYVEVYNDAVNDMLATDKEKSTFLQLRETAPGHIEPEGVTKVGVKDASEVMAAVARGDKNRVVAAMAMNPRSSRGHGIITVEVLTSDGQPHGRLSLVDLAGMESSKKSPPEGASNVAARRQEAKAINMSLLALSSVVSALASKGAMRIPFRNSKLTRLLQSSLAGNCKSAFVVSLRSEARNTEEAIGTLRFAQRAKSVEATVVKNADARKPKENGAANKALAEELANAKHSLADFESKLASADAYKGELVAQVHTLLGEMHALQRDSEDAKKKMRLAAAVTPADSKMYPGYVQALEKRVIRLEEENRVLRQRDIMHRMVELDGSSSGGQQPPAATAATAATAAPAAPLKLQFSRSNLVTFDPVALEKPGFDMIVQKDSIEVEAKLKRQKSEAISSSSGPKARRRWFALRGPGLIVGGLLFKRSGKAGASVTPGSPGRGKQGSAKSLLNLEETARRAVAARRIQNMWRDKMARDEMYWEMMGYFD